MFNATLSALQYLQSGAVVETLEKKQRNVSEFLGSILHHANSFSML